MKIRFREAILGLLMLVPAIGYCGNQMNVDLGLDRPESGAAHASSSGLLRFQLQTTPRFFRLLSAFNMVVGSNLMMGEITLGPSIHFLSKLYEEARIQPFVGAEGIGAFGSKDARATLTGGYGIFAGTDLRVFGKKSGLSLAIESTYVGQQSLRVWLGFFHCKTD